MSALSQEERMLVAAMELLRRQLGDTSVILAAANTQKSDADYLKQAAEALQFVADRAPGGFGPARPVAPTPPPADLGGAGAPVVIDRKLPKRPDTDPGPGGIETKENKADREPNAQKALKAWHDDPARKEANAAKQLASAQRAERNEKLKGNPIASVLTGVAAKFAAVLGPAALLSQVLQSNLSGFQVLGTAVKVLATTLAPILLPVTAALAAGVLAVSDVLMEHLMPAMDTWFQFVLGSAIPAIAFLIDMFNDAAEGVSGWIEDLDGAGKAVREWAAERYRDAQQFNPFTSEEEDEKFIRSNITGDGSDGEPGDERRFLGMKWSSRGRGEEATGRGLADTLRSLRMSMGPRATVTGLGGVGQAIQSAALNQDPLEARMLKVQTDMLNRLDRIAANTRGRGRPGPFDVGGASGAGDYAGGSASATDTGGDYGGV